MTWKDKGCLTILLIFGIMLGVKNCERTNEPVTSSAARIFHRAKPRYISKVHRKTEASGIPNIRIPESDLVFKRTKWNFSLAPGIQVAAPGVMGLDFRFARVGDFGFNVGAAYFSADKKIGDTLTVGYNLRKSRLLSNVDLIAGGSYTRKTILFGIRLELGEW